MPTRPPARMEFQRTMPIGALNDTEAECEFSTDEDTVTLEAATIHGRRFTASDLAEWLGQSEVDGIDAMAREWWMATGWNEAAQDWLDNLADYQRDMRDDR